MSVFNLSFSRGKRLLLAAWIGFAVAVAPQAAMAVSASPHPVHVTQPDGTEIVLRVRGNERFHWQEDANGYTVLLDEGRYVYARRGANGNLAPTDLQVGQADPRAYGLAKRVLPAQAAIDRIRANAPGSATNDTQGAPEQIAPSGAIKNLVIPIRFSNHVGRTTPSEIDLGVLFNNVGSDPLAPTGSLRDVYLENSYGTMELNSTIADWVPVSNSEQYYANGVSGDQTLHQALIEALNAADAYIDFRDFDQDGDGYIDSITFLHSGYGAEWGGPDVDGTDYSDRIWSHRWVLWDTNGDGIYTPQDQEWTSNEGIKVWDYHISPTLWSTSGSTIGRVGVIAHETGHFFGLPDLYDTNGGGQGIGSFGLMANSWGFNGTQLYPPHMSPWSKAQLGWVAPTTLSAPGTYQLQAVENSSEVYRIDQGFPSGEYLLIENRQATGFDGDMPQDGLAIWHIDEQANDVDEGYPGQGSWPNNGRHYRVALLQADGNYNLERGNNRGDGGDVWHGGGGGVDEINGNTLPSTDTYQNGIVVETGNRIYGISVSGNTRTFDYDDGVTPPPPPTPPLAPDGLLADAVGAQVDLSWNDNADNEDGYLVFRDGFEIDSLSANSTDYIDSGVPAGSHDYFVRAHNGAGGVNSNIYNVEVILPMMVYASGESTGFGTVDGNYLNTTVVAGEETITETESRGRNKTSRLDHTWQVDGVAGGALVMLYVDAYAPANGEQDDFEFEVAVNGGGYQTAFTLINGNDQERVVELPFGTVGTVFIRVFDKNRTKGNSVLDSVSVRQIYIESSGEMILTAPTNLAATPLSSRDIELEWDDGAGETQYIVEELIDTTWSGTALPSLAANTISTIVGSLAPDSSYTYRVCGIDGTSVPECSNSATATTLPDTPLGGVTLSATGRKVKGVQHADLSWSGTAGASVDVYRDGNLVATTANDGGYDDNIGKKGGGSYVYKVCDAGTSNCSDTVTVIF